MYFEATLKDKALKFFRLVSISFRAASRCVAPVLVARKIFVRMPDSACPSLVSLSV